MNAASGKHGFRGFASKLRDQAKDAVGNYKLPTFDDMAKNDNYIHSPEFNVRGSSRSGKIVLRQEEEMNTKNSIATNGASLNGITDEASNYSTESPWSLLDRPSNTTMVTTSATTIKQKRNNEESHNHCRQENDNDNDNTSYWKKATKSSSVPEKIIEQGKEVAQKRSLSLLSIVSDALQPTMPVPATVSTVSTAAAAATTTKDHDDDIGRGEYNRNELNRYRYDSDDNSDQSSEDFDEEDPILSIIRNKNNNNNDSSNYNNDVKNDEKYLISNDAPASVIMTKKPSNRFMEDLRLQAPVELHQDFDGIQKIHSTTAKNTETEFETKDSNNGGPFGGYFKNTAIQNFKRIILRRGSNTPDQQQRSPPPLARERTAKPELEERDDFQITASTSVGMLGDEDFERLKQLKIAGESSSALSSVSITQKNIHMLMQYLREHQHFLFVTLTLILSIYVYFRGASTSKMV